ncbi:hypothetical protein [Companilactobacillus ginsenosidimutans]|uniref:hypothetical protein n=1 Tax=Companilactobacillus ginsenosidimutans TaxID=1007676 RepID=UPI000AE5BBAD|nr:hypothetical protein [Companilactobacillus ginsenosidimutans]
MFEPVNEIDGIPVDDQGYTEDERITMAEFAELLFQTEGEGSVIRLPNGEEKLVDY